MLRSYVALSCLLLLTASASAQPSDCNQPASSAITQIEVPGHPFSAIPSADGCSIFVSMTAKNGESKIAVIARSGGVMSIVRTVAAPGQLRGLALNRDGHRRSAFELLAYPEIEWDALRGIWPELSAVDPSIAVHLEIDAKYDVYLKRQTADVDAFRRDEGLVLTDIDYADVPGLSNEARAKLEAARPRTVGQAGRLDGLTPAALGILAAYLRREARRKTSKATA